MAFTLLVMHFAVLASTSAVVNVRDSYSFSYAVNAEATGDFKSHQESRSGGLVKGSYSVLEPGGILRTVEYTADPIRGFRAVVHRRALDNNATARLPIDRLPTTKEMMLTKTTERFPTKTEEMPIAAEGFPKRKEKIIMLNTTERSFKTTEELPIAAEKFPKRRSRLSTTTEKLPIATEKLSDKTRFPQTTEVPVMTTNAPDNLGHFAAVMFFTRRKKLNRRRRQ